MSRVMRTVAARTNAHSLRFAAATAASTSALVALIAVPLHTDMSGVVCLLTVSSIGSFPGHVTILGFIYYDAQRAGGATHGPRGPDGGVAAEPGRGPRQPAGTPAVGSALGAG